MLTEDQPARMKLCKDCRWGNRFGTYYNDYYCTHPLLQRPPQIDPVSGETVNHKWLCHTERILGSKCGPDGNLWEPKDGAEPAKPPGFV